MFRLVEGDSRGLKDVDAFIGLINSRRSFFDTAKNIFVARAPGRLDVMGGIADYSGSLVLQMPIAEATLAAVQQTDDQTITIISVAGDDERYFSIGLSRLLTAEYRDTRKLFRHPENWAAYACGAFNVLNRERAIEFSTGAKIFISSDVPIGKGVSSSAALEIAVMLAVCAAFDIAVEPREMALLCQKLENELVGAPCGVMDQIASNCGAENALISLLCQPAEIQSTIRIPDNIKFWGIDSGVKHAVAGSDYSTVRIGAFMGYRIIGELAGLECRSVRTGLVAIEDVRWKGYLCNVTPAEYDKLSSKIPTEISGSKFLEKYTGTTDTVTKIDPEKVYPVRAATEHAVYEHSRVTEFAELMGNMQGDRQSERMGELMFESHGSYAACRLTEPGTDRLVELGSFRRKDHGRRKWWYSRRP
jgi:galactokinase